MGGGALVISPFSLRAVQAAVDFYLGDQLAGDSLFYTKLAGNVVRGQTVMDWATLPLSEC